MVPKQSLDISDLILAATVLLVAAGARFGYVATFTHNDGSQPAPLAVQTRHDPTANFHVLLDNLKKHRWFGAKAPMSENLETTGHTSPGYPWLAYWISRFDPSREADLRWLQAALRWLQAALGTWTVGCYFFFAHRAFQSKVATALTGFFLALHPFWIINTAELADGVLASFFLAAALVLGTRASQVGGAFASLLFGLTLAGMSMTRAALLPFALIALVWFLFRCRSIKLGWFCGLLAFLGFANGLAPWAVRNYQVFEEPVPIVTSTYLHLYMGNNSQATGGPLLDKTLWDTLTAEQQQDLPKQSPDGKALQAKRYAKLGRLAIDHAVHDPGKTLGLRLSASLDFVFGEAWFTKKQYLVDVDEGWLARQKLDDPDNPDDPEDIAFDLRTWLIDNVEAILRGSLLAMLVLGGLGWRFTSGWRRQARLATLAMIWVPLPYILGHADTLCGPRLPLDGVLLCYAAFAVACLFPGTARGPTKAINR